MYENIKYNGKIYRIEKLPYETNEQVMDRGWYIINKLNSNQEQLDYDTIYADSLKWIHEKYIKVKYL